MVKLLFKMVHIPEPRLAVFYGIIHLRVNFV